MCYELFAEWKTRINSKGSTASVDRHVQTAVTWRWKPLLIIIHSPPRRPKLSLIQLIKHGSGRAFVLQDQLTQKKKWLHISLRLLPLFLHFFTFHNKRRKLQNVVGAFRTCLRCCATLLLLLLPSGVSLLSFLLLPSPPPCHDIDPWPMR